MMEPCLCVATNIVVIRRVFAGELPRAVHFPSAHNLMRRDGIVGTEVSIYDVYPPVWSSSCFGMHGRCGFRRNPLRFRLVLEGPHDLSRGSNG